MLLANPLHVASSFALPQDFAFSWTAHPAPEAPPLRINLPPLDMAASLAPPPAPDIAVPLDLPLAGVTLREGPIREALALPDAQPGLAPFPIAHAPDPAAPPPMASPSPVPIMPPAFEPPLPPDPGLPQPSPLPVPAVTLPVTPPPWPEPLLHPPLPPTPPADPATFLEALWAGHLPLGWGAPPPPPPHLAWHML